ncbi:hypothetical protein EVA_11833 [gut metagenome]|uniref:Uncharacterized protein n=1 Tax=gut metagenome TaxID=749906 RepID=J9FYN4_9ZZZZ
MSEASIISAPSASRFFADCCNFRSVDQHIAVIEYIIIFITCHDCFCIFN